LKTIILEGPDGAGKTYLADILQKQHGYRFQHFGVPPKGVDIFDFFFKPLLHLTGNGEWPRSKVAPVVIDRLHLSEIYSPVMRGKKSPLTECMADIIERYVEAIDGQIVLCLPPRRVAFQNWLSRKGDEYVDKAEKFHKIYDGYVELLLQRNRNFVWYDYTRYSASSFAQSLVTVHGYPLPPGVLGSQRPRFLFVGERASSAPDLPFATYKGSSGWLHDCLHDAGYEEADMAFVNAYGLDNSENDLPELVLHLRALPYNLPPPTVIALGHAAAMRCQQLNFPFESVPHPQHSKRFKSKERAQYVRRLAEIRRKSK